MINLTKDQVERRVKDYYKENRDGKEFPYPIVWFEDDGHLLGSVTSIGGAIIKLSLNEKILEARNKVGLDYVLLHELAHIIDIEDSGSSSHRDNFIKIFRELYPQTTADIF